MEITPRSRLPCRAILIRAITIAVVLSVSAMAPSNATTNQTRTAPKVVIEDATREERALVKWALTRYKAAGLPLPAITFAFHDSNEGCRGVDGTYQGLYRHATGTIDICNRGRGKTDPRHTILHELAHAWSLTHMTEDAMTDFVARRGLDDWFSDEAAWWQMGQEQAAEIIAWGLQDANEYKSIWLFLESCESLADAFELLTGTGPLHANIEYCA